MRRATRAPASPAQCGGQPCDEDQERSRPCNTFTCPAQLCVWAGWEDWSDWSEAAVVVEARMVRRRVRVRQQEGGQDCVRVGNQTDFTDVPVVPIVTSDPPEPESSNYQALPVYLSAGFLGCLGKF